MIVEDAIAVNTSHASSFSGLVPQIVGAGVDWVSDPGKLNVVETHDVPTTALVAVAQSSWASAKVDTNRNAKSNFIFIELRLRWKTSVVRC